MQIDLLKYHPQHAMTLATWFKAESPGYFRDQTIAQIAEQQFIARMNDDTLPISFVALDGDLIAGTVALVQESISTHTHLRPWVGGLYVDQAYRHRGIAMQLVQTALDKAEALGFERVYIGISAAEQQYLDRGWQIEERVIYHDHPLSILRHDLHAYDDRL